MKEAIMYISLILLVAGGFIGMNRIGHFLDRYYKRTYVKLNNKDTKIIWNKEDGNSEMEKEMERLRRPLDQDDDWGSVDEESGPDVLSSESVGNGKEESPL